jgi:3-oxoacyl-[acyl-carrier-protein] synthase II
MALFIKGMGNISPQKTWDAESLPNEIVKPNSDRFTAIEPDYSQFIDPKNIRRMSRIIKLGIGAATIALGKAGVKVPDAIITGTGYGCLEDTGTFLAKMVENNEVALNPTPFIQSTHNTIGSQIALLLQCQGYNQTYAHGAFSFESVLLDALIQSEEEPQKNILLGGIDEITNVSHTIQKRFGIFKEVANGEGSSFMLVNGERENSIACIESVATFYKPDMKVLAQHIQTIERKVDLVLLGGSQEELFTEKLKSYFSNSSIGYFKHLCGEYPVASAFAVSVAAGILRNQNVPKSILVTSPKSEIKNILILNQYFGTHYSAIILSAC